MKAQNVGTRIMVSILVLVFWLAILFLDGAFSSRSLLDTRVSDMTEISLASSLETSLDTSLQTGTIQTWMAFAPQQKDVQTMITDTIQQVESSETFKDLNVLEYVYRNNKNSELLLPMIEKFLAYYQFEKANQYLDVLVTQQWGYLELELDPRQVLYARFHDSHLSLDSDTALDDIFVFVDTYVSKGQLNADDALFYAGLKALRVYDYTAASAAFAKITDARYQDFVASYESSLANYVKIKNPPAYYRDGLVSLTLLKNGYFTFAKRLALRAAAQDKSYILPYQVLAYTNFLTHNRESAKEYFATLATFDTSNVFLYNFLIGICYYRYGDYEQAVLYLNQVTDPWLQIDVYRYMLLSYIKVQDTNNMIRMFHNILWQQSLQTSDFALFFDQMLYVPFRTGSPFTLYTENQQLADMYLSKCWALFSGSQSDICSYGTIWIQLAKQDIVSIGDQLLSLTSKYQQSHLYHALGSYYASIAQIQMAKEAYVKALSISDDLKEQEVLKNKIASLAVSDK